MPGFQPLVPWPERVINEPGCVLFLRPSTIQKMTKKPVTDRYRAARTKRGTILGDRNKGAATATVNYGESPALRGLPVKKRLAR